MNIGASRSLAESVPRNRLGHIATLEGKFPPFNKISPRGIATRPRTSPILRIPRFTTISP